MFQNILKQTPQKNSQKRYFSSGLLLFKQHKCSTQSFFHKSVALRKKSLYYSGVILVQIRENKYHNNSEYGHFLSNQLEGSL